VSAAASRKPVLLRYYKQYLRDEDSAAFIQAVSRHYLIGALERLAHGGDRVSRRAAVMALGFLGDYASNAVLGRALHDADRGVRLLADNGIRELWTRDGDETQRQRLAVVIRLNANQQHPEAVQKATELIDDSPWFAEAWNQRAIAYFHLGQFEDSANDSHQTLELNPYHFGAAIGIAHCYLELDDAHSALENFRRALRLNPDLEGVRAQIEYLQRTLGR
jgi:tetratricopeptide (TPR) repeat protein